MDSSACSSSPTRSSQARAQPGSGSGNLFSRLRGAAAWIPLDSRRFLVGLWVAMLLLRLLLAFHLFTHPRQPDEATYRGIAESVARQNGYSIHGRPTAIVVPVFPLLLAGLLKVFGTIPAPLAVLHVGFGLVLALACGRIVQRLTGSSRLARFSEIVLFWLPPYVAYSGFALTEILFSALLACTFWSLDTVSRHPCRLVPWILLALFHTLALLTRPVTALLTPLLWLWPLIRGRFQRKALLGAFLGTLVFLALWGPWCARNAHVFHRWIPLSSFSGFTLIAANLDDIDTFSAVAHDTLDKAGVKDYYDDEIASNDILVREAKRRIREDKTGWILRIFTRAWRVWLWEYPRYFDLSIRFREAASTGRIDLLALKGLLLLINVLVPVLGLYGVFRLWRRVEAWPWIVALVYFTFIHSALMPINRYSVPVAGLAVILGLAGLHAKAQPRSPDAQSD